MTFPYFAHYKTFAAFLEDETACDICQETQTCLDASAFYGEETLEAICPDCLSKGRLKEHDIFTNEADTEELSKQLHALHPTWPTADVDKVVQEKTQIIEKMTPPIVTWQDWCWPAADGDYCKFIGYGSKTMFKRLAKEEEPAEFFENSLYGASRKYADTEVLWEESMPPIEIRKLADSQAYTTLFYIFESRASGRVVTLWDVS